MQDELKFTQPVYTPLMTITERFEEFHKANHQVYRKLCELCRQLLHKGHKHFGIKLAWERIRWELYMNTTDANSGFRLDDHYTSRYSRLIASQESDLASVFEKRKLRSE